MRQLTRNQLQSHVLSNYWKNMDADYVTRQLSGMELPKGYAELVKANKEKTIARQKA